MLPERQYLDEARMSVVFFALPDKDVLIETLDGSGKYPPVTAGKWFNDRAVHIYGGK